LTIGILQNDKIMNICDSVTTSTVRDRRPHFRDALSAAFTSTPERAHQKSNITVADVSEISASEHEIGRM
jgi:hypothetical protein